jgi:hypothetical protein
MRKLSALVAVAVVAATGAAGTGESADRVRTRDVALEFVGQVTNSPPGVSPATSSQYGYLSYVSGIPVFEREPADESTARFTFTIRATAVRVLADGPVRIITRLGRLTVYSDPATNGTFSSPATFADGRPILVASLRQQVLVDTLTNTFTTLNRNRILSTVPFRAGGATVRLGKVGARFDTFLSGHQNMPGPPSAYFAGSTAEFRNP